MTPGEHYDRANFIVGATSAGIERLVESANKGLIEGEDLKVELELHKMFLQLAAVHATLATVTP